MNATNDSWLVVGDDGENRCAWGGSTDDYVAYHDNEWGRPVSDDDRLFEKICLEGFQSGLSWLTILRKRENFRSAFADFDYETVADFGDDDVSRLLGDAGIVRHRKKIESTINNAKRAVELTGEFGSLGAYFWQWEPTEIEGDRSGEWPIPSITPTSTAMSKDLKSRGWSFIGPTTAYAFMQAMGLVNDHMPGCFVYDGVEDLRSRLTRPESPAHR